MPISEERLQLLMPRQLKAAVQRRAKRVGVSVGEYVRRLIESDLKRNPVEEAGVDFPFGHRPIHTGRRHGSVKHDRP